MTRQDFDKWKGEASEKHGFRVPYDGSNKFYDDKAIEHFEHGAEATFNLLSKKIENLQRWKTEATAVMPDFQEIGKIVGIKLGESVHDKIIPEIAKLKEEVNEYSRNLKNCNDHYSKRFHELSKEISEKDEEIEKLKADNERYIEILKLHRQQQNKSDRPPFDLGKLH